MTLEEFLARLKAKTEDEGAKWSLDKAGGLRTEGTEGDCHCPISFVIGDPKAFCSPILMGVERLNLSRNVARAIAAASDERLHSVDWRCSIRDLLLKTVGLEGAQNANSEWTDERIARERKKFTSWCDQPEDDGTAEASLAISGLHALDEIERCGKEIERLKAEVAETRAIDADCMEEDGLKIDELLARDQRQRALLRECCDVVAFFRPGRDWLEPLAARILAELGDAPLSVERDTAHVSCE